MSFSQNIFDTLSQNTESDEFEFVKSSSAEMPFQAVNEYIEDERGNIFESMAKDIENESFTFLETSRDVTEQAGAKLAAGFLGNYGNIAETIGLQTSEKLLPGQKARIQSSFEDPYDLGLDDEILPSFHRLATSKDIKDITQELTGIGEGKTPTGRIAGRGAEFVGEGLSMPGGGLKSLAALGISGLAGQGIREAGGPEALATGTEIAGSILPSLIQGKLVPTRGSAAEEIVQAGRRIGLTEKQITPLIQGERKVATLAKFSRKGEKTKELFSSIKEGLGDSYSQIKHSVANVGKIGVPIQKNLINKFNAIKTDLQKTLKASPDKEAAINFIGDAVKKISKDGATPEELINFWQDINKSVKWGSIQGGKKSLSQLKEPILETLNKVAPAAAKDFELTNKLYAKYAQFSQKLKPDMIEAVISKAEALSIPVAGVALVTGNPWALKAVLGEAALRTLANEMLINPYFQNLGNKLIKNFNSGSMKAVTESVKQAKDYLTRKYPEENWSFLTED